jgi:hypothetical protein
MAAAIFYITTGNAFCDIARLAKGTNDGGSRELRRLLFDENENRESEVSLFMSERCVILYAKLPYRAVGGVRN